jgi:hypothetical protein
MVAEPELAYTAAARHAAHNAARLPHQCSKLFFGHLEQISTNLLL